MLTIGRKVGEIFYIIKDDDVIEISIHRVIKKQLKIGINASLDYKIYRPKLLPEKYNYLLDVDK